jgi:DNA-binding NarL/FixJ family response regulator
LIESLSNREREVLKLIAQGRSNREIAETLFVSVRTVESHRASLLKKLNQKNTASLVKVAIEKGYV